MATVYCGHRLDVVKPIAARRRPTRLYGCTNAERLLLDALALRRASLEADDPQTGNALIWLARTRVEMVRAGEAAK